MNIIERVRYVESLRNFYHKSKGHIPPAILDKVAPEIKEILFYEAKGKDDIIRSHILNLIGQLLGAVVYSILAIYVLQEVFTVSANLSLRNVMLLSVLIFSYKAKFRLSHSV